MADHQKVSGLYGQSPSSLYCQGNGTTGCGNGDASGVAGEDQQYFEESDWPFQDTPPYDYDVASFYQQGWNMNNMNQQIAVQDGLPGPQSIPLPPPSMNELGPSAYAMTTPVASPIVAQARPMVPEATISFLTDDQRQKLQKIAMPTTIPYHSPRSEPSPDSAGGAGKSSTSSSPAGIRDSVKPITRKRKSSTEENDDEDDDDDDSHQPVKKTAHNMIEKRYRTNLNDKIAALRDSVPSLRIMSKSARGEDTTVDREELQGLTPAHKLNKATVLSKATEYIRHLEKRNSRLVDENTIMQQRIAAFEKLFMSGAMNNAMNSHQQQHAAPPTPTTYPIESTIFAPSPMGTSRPDPQGMIQVPDDMKRIIDAQRAAGQPYPIPQPTFRQNPAIVRQQQVYQQQAQMQAGGWSNATPYFGKLMVGSLAGLMLLEAISENEKSSETPDGRGLFALPVQLLKFLTNNLNIHFMGYSMQATQVLYSFKVFLLLCSLWWALAPSLTGSQPPSMKQSKETPTAPKAAPSLASPIHVRRQAWLTAVQTVWVPRRHMLLEASALGLKALKLSLRNLIGVHGYQLLTGLTPEEEIARVKAWEIALDAQLAGGDIEISKRRLTLTFLASSTLPTTPVRLMLKALHIRVLLWDCGPTGMRTALQVIAAKYARSHWNQAKQLYRLSSQLRRSGQELHDDDLPDHLAALLEQECDDVLNPSIIQRAHNLAWNRPTEHNEISRVDGMATVTDDSAVRSPMDAVAAWWSSMILQGALTTSLLVSEDEDNDTSQHIDLELSLAIRTAPIGSVAQQRALVARALLSNEKRGFNIVAALHAIGPVTPILMSGTASRMNNYAVPLVSVKELAAQENNELGTSLLCAMSIAHLQKFSPPDEPVNMYWVINQIQPACDMGLLGYTAAYKLMDRLTRHEFAAEACSNTLERFSGRLRIWTGKGASLEPEIRHQIVERCLAVTRGQLGMDFDTDTGYGSMSETDSDSGTLSFTDSGSDSDPDPQPETTVETADLPSCGCNA